MYVCTDVMQCNVMLCFVLLCMFVCLYVCMYVYMCLYVFICVYMCVYVCICVCAYYTIYVRIYKHITPVTPDIYQSTSSGFHRRFDSTPQVVEHHGSVRSCWQATDHADVKLRIALHCRTGSQRCNHKAQKRPDEKVQENFYLGSLRQKWWKNGQWMTRWLAPSSTEGPAEYLDTGTCSKRA